MSLPPVMIMGGFLIDFSQCIFEHLGHKDYQAQISSLFCYEVVGQRSQRLLGEKVGRNVISVGGEK